MHKAPDLLLFLREPRSLVHLTHQGKSRLRSLAASVELDHGLVSGSRLNERLIGDCDRELPRSVAVPWLVIPC